MVEGYRQRTYNEDMMRLEKLGGNKIALFKSSYANTASYSGPKGLMSKLKTSMDHGLVPTDFNDRAEQFGSNYKAPPKITPYWRLFLNAMDDFMLKFLLVCAAIQISIELGFSTPDKRKMGK